MDSTSRILAVEFQLDGETTEMVEAGFGLLLDTAIEQTHRGEVARVLEGLSQSQRAAAAAVVIPGRPMISAAASAYGRQRDRFIHHQGIGLQAFAERCQVAQRLDRGSGLALRLHGAV